MPDLLFYGLLALAGLVWAVISLLHRNWKHKQRRALEAELERERERLGW